jgi:hypothetical protein
MSKRTKPKGDRTKTKAEVIAMMKRAKGGTNAGGSQFYKK